MFDNLVDPYDRLAELERTSQLLAQASELQAQQLAEQARLLEHVSRYMRDLSAGIMDLYSRDNERRETLIKLEKSR
jgi:hypothetical protein